MSENVVYLKSRLTPDPNKKKKLDRVRAIADVQARFAEMIATCDTIEAEELRNSLQEAEIAARRLSLRLAIDLGLIECIDYQDVDEA